MKYGILLAVFGSNSNQGKAALSCFEAQVRRRFPDVHIRWSYTSRRIRNHVDSNDEKIDSVKDTLVKMASEHFTHIAVQPLHVISGVEYSEIISTVQILRRDPSFPVVLVGNPLLTENTEVVSKAVKAIFTCIPKERGAEEPVLFMGHGSRRLSDDKYMGLAKSVSQKDSLVFIGTMNGKYRLEHILPELKNVNHRVWLLPLLALVGNHALEDMAGAQQDSWRSTLESHGFTCIPVLKGMIEYSTFTEIWIDHLECSLDLLYSSSCLNR